GGGVQVASPMTIGGSLTGTNITTGSGTNNTGWLQSASTAVTGTIDITASSGSTVGTATGIYITGGTMSTAGTSALLLSGEAIGPTTSDGGFGINITGGQISSAGGAIQLSGNVDSSVVPNAVALNATNAIVSATGSIQLSGTAAGNAAIGVRVNQP